MIMPNKGLLGHSHKSEVLDPYKKFYEQGLLDLIEIVHTIHLPFYNPDELLSKYELKHRTPYDLEIAKHEFIEQIIKISPNFMESINYILENCKNKGLKEENVFDSFGIVQKFKDQKYPEQLKEIALQVINKFILAYQSKLSEQDDKENAHWLAKFLVLNHFHLLANTDIEVSEENKNSILPSKLIEAYAFFKLLRKLTAAGQNGEHIEALENQPVFQSLEHLPNILEALDVIMCKFKLKMETEPGTELPDFFIHLELLACGFMKSMEGLYLSMKHETLFNSNHDTNSNSDSSKNDQALGKMIGERLYAILAASFSEFCSSKFDYIKCPIEKKKKIIDLMSKCVDFFIGTALGGNDLIDTSSYNFVIMNLRDRFRHFSESIQRIDNKDILACYKITDPKNLAKSRLQFTIHILQAFPTLPLLLRSAISMDEPKKSVCSFKLQRMFELDYEMYARLYYPEESKGRCFVNEPFSSKISSSTSGHLSAVSPGTSSPKAKRPFKLVTYDDEIPSKLIEYFKDDGLIRKNKKGRNKTNECKTIQKQYEDSVRFRIFQEGRIEVNYEADWHKSDNQIHLEITLQGIQSISEQPGRPSRGVGHQNSAQSSGRNTQSRTNLSLGISSSNQRQGHDHGNRLNFNHGIKAPNQQHSYATIARGQIPSQGSVQNPVAQNNGHRNQDISGNPRGNNRRSEFQPLMPRQGSSQNPRRHNYNGRNPSNNMNVRGNHSRQATIQSQRTTPYNERLSHEPNRNPYLSTSYVNRHRIYDGTHFFVQRGMRRTWSSSERNYNWEGSSGKNI